MFSWWVMLRETSSMVIYTQKCADFLRFQTSLFKIPPNCRVSRKQRILWRKIHSLLLFESAQRLPADPFDPVRSLTVKYTPSLMEDHISFFVCSNSSCRFTRSFVSADARWFFFSGIKYWIEGPLGFQFCRPICPILAFHLSIWQFIYLFDF